MPYTTTTLETFRELLARRWDESVFWTAAEARIAINEALRDWNLLTGRWRRRTTIATLPADPTLTLPAALTFGLRVRNTTTGQPLHPTSVTELDFGRPTWRRETTADGGTVPTQPLLWAPESLQRLVLWPIPSPVSTVDVDGIAATPVLVEDADYVDVGDEILDLLADYALHILTFKEGGDRWRKTKVFWTAFLQAAADENALLKRSQRYRRLMGADRRRDLDPPRQGPTGLDAAVGSIGGGGGGA